MWDYVAFFGYNFLFFLFALFVWHVFPRPKPYDYTTIPGLKPDSNAFDDGNMNEMRVEGALATFLGHLHQDYGPLSSFYWGRQYVVAVGSVALWRDLIDWSGKVATKIDVMPFLSDSTAVSIPPLDRVQEIISSTAWTEALGDSMEWQLAIDILFNFKERDHTVDAMKRVLLDIEQGFTSRSYTENVDDSRKEQFHATLVCRALKRSVSVAESIRHSIRELGENRTRRGFEDWSRDSTLRSIVFECIRSAVPFEYVFYSFDGEIDLLGHPVPVGTPIVVDMRNVFTTHSELEEATSYSAIRFRSNSGKAFHFGQCLSHLPYFDLLSSVIAARLYTT